MHVGAVAVPWMRAPRGGAGLWRTLSFQALGLDQDNEKGLYRRGEARLLMNEFELAKCDFQKVLEVNPQNKAARSQISVCQKKTKEHNERDRRIYANMFTKFAERDAKVGAARVSGRPDSATLRDAQQARGEKRRGKTEEIGRWVEDAEVWEHGLQLIEPGWEGAGCFLVSRGRRGCCQVVSKSIYGAGFRLLITGLAFGRRPAGRSRWPLMTSWPSAVWVK